jgi:hypothetical protein
MVIAWNLGTRSAVFKGIGSGNHRLRDMEEQSESVWRFKGWLTLTLKPTSV